LLELASDDTTVPYIGCSTGLSADSKLSIGLFLTGDTVDHAWNVTTTLSSTSSLLELASDHTTVPYIGCSTGLSTDSKLSIGLFFFFFTFTP